MNVRTTVLGLVLLSQAACAAVPPPAVVASERDRNVLTAVLKSSCVLFDGKYSLLSSQTPPVVPEGLPRVPRRYRAAVENLATRNEHRNEVPVDLECEGVKLARASEIESIFAGDRFLDDKWTDFFGTFPDAREIMRVTLPGYSVDGNAAAVYISGESGSLAGAGGLCLLERKGGEWRVVRTISVWVS